MKFKDWKFQKGKPVFQKDVKLALATSAVEAGLPEPVDPDGKGRVTKWVRMMRGPSLYYYGWKMDLSKEYFDFLVANTVTQNGENYRTPLIRQHEPTGDRFGEIVDFAVLDEQGDGIWSLFACVVFLEDADMVTDKINRGIWSSVSVGIWESEDSTDGAYRECINELSLVSMPHINDAKIVASKNGKGKLDMDEETLALAIASALKALGIGVEDEPVEDEPVEDEGVAAEDHEDNVGVAAGRRIERLQAELAAKTAELAKAESELSGLTLASMRTSFDATYADGMALIVTSENREALFALASQNLEAWNNFVSKCHEAPKVEASSTPEPASTQTIEIPNEWGKIKTSSDHGGSNEDPLAGLTGSERQKAIKAMGGIKKYFASRGIKIT